MKKTTLVQSDLSYVIATPGHMDTLVIADAGLPVPAETLRIDLALTQGIPGAIQTLRVVLAEEVKERNPGFLAEVHVLLPGVPVEFGSYSDFKDMTTSSRAVVRTGEFAP